MAHITIESCINKVIASNKNIQANELKTALSAHIINLLSLNAITNENAQELLMLLCEDSKLDNLHTKYQQEITKQEIEQKSKELRSKYEALTEDCIKKFEILNIEADALNQSINQLITQDDSEEVKALRKEKHDNEQHLLRITEMAISDKQLREKLDDLCKEIKKTNKNIDTKINELQQQQQKQYTLHNADLLKHIKAFYQRIAEHKVLSATLPLIKDECMKIITSAEHVKVERDATGNILDINMHTLSWGEISLIIDDIITIFRPHLFHTCFYEFITTTSNGAKKRMAAVMSYLGFEAYGSFLDMYKVKTNNVIHYL